MHFIIAWQGAFLVVCALDGCSSRPVRFIFDTVCVIALGCVLWHAVHAGTTIVGSGKFSLSVTPNTWAMTITLRYTQPVAPTTTSRSAVERLLPQLPPWPTQQRVRTDATAAKNAGVFHGTGRTRGLPSHGVPLFSNNEPTSRQGFDGNYNANRSMAVATPVPLGSIQRVELATIITGKQGRLLDPPPPQQTHFYYDYHDY